MPPRTLRRALVAGLGPVMLLPVTTALGRAQDAARTVAESRITPFQARKAEALLRDHLPCLGCHALNGQGGQIGPDLAGVAARRTPEYIAAIVTDPQGIVPGSVMPRTPMPDATRALIIRYLAADPEAGAARPGSVAAPVSRSSAQRGTRAGATRETAVVAAGPSSAAVPTAAPNGAVLYARLCAACHGARGRGDGPNAAHLPVPPSPHASRDAMARRSDDALFDTIHGGGAIMGRSSRMPAYGLMLTGDEIRALVRHIRVLCRCEGPGWSRGSRQSP